MALRAPSGGWVAGIVIAIALTLGLTACGGETGSVRAGTETSAAQSRTAPGVVPLPPAHGPSARVEPDAEAVVRRWADTLRRGDVEGAARLFALPAVVANGTRPVTLDSRAQLRVFNRSLPCGAVLVGTSPAAHGFLVATFRLTERPGHSSCGSGTGNTARTAVHVKDGLIAYWLRLDTEPVPAPAPGRPAPQEPAPEAPANPGESIA
jgi:hypothetical protein